VVARHRLGAVMLSGLAMASLLWTVLSSFLMHFALWGIESTIFERLWERVTVEAIYVIGELQELTIFSPQFPNSINSFGGNTFPRRE